MKEASKTSQELLDEFINLPNVGQLIKDARKTVDEIDRQSAISRIREEAADLQERAIDEIGDPSAMARIREEAADLQERAAELGLIRPENRLDLNLPMASIAILPLPEINKSTNRSSKKEQRIQVIVAAAAAEGFNVLKIPRGGKSMLRKLCMTSHRDLFGVGADSFKEAWQEALNQNRVRTVEHEKYSSR
jgi:hypothetical protein